jgi:hypothetical protein
MTAIYVARVNWTGSYDHQGISRFAFVSSDGGVPTNTQRDGVLTAIEAMLHSGAPSLPTDLSWVIDPVIESYDGVLGTILGELPTAGAVAPDAGLGTSSFANGVGLTIKWKTGGTFHGRRIQGRTFIVPLDGYVFSTDGRVLPETAAEWQGFANTYIAAMAPLNVDPLVWGRPQDVKASKRTPAHHNPGHWATISSAIVDTRPAILGRRR